MIAQAHDGILAALRGDLPGLRDVLDYGVAEQLATPAAVLRLAGMEPDDAPEDGSGRLDMRCRWEVFLVLASRTPGVERRLRALAAAAAVLLHGNRFGLAAPPARFVLAEANEFEPSWKGAQSWRVEFEQVLHLGESVWDAEGVVPQTVLASHSPLVGSQHEQEYEEISNGV